MDKDFEEYNSLFVKSDINFFNLTERSGALVKCAASDRSIVFPFQRFVAERD